jgi:hypothetical protein
VKGMATQSKIQHLSRRIEALAAQAKGNFGIDSIGPSPKEELMRRIRVISDRMREAAEERGEPFPPPLSPEERDDIVRRFREFCSSRACR